jgi:hypothetical protein
VYFGGDKIIKGSASTTSIPSNDDLDGGFQSLVYSSAEREVVEHEKQKKDNVFYIPPDKPYYYMKFATLSATPEPPQEPYAGMTCYSQ